ncbi:MAG: hypothetical protein L6R40_006010 [Gallowayella cf. fulva]|nr:MAG: hypothetical protein L6R40_006010 [Xanthomendoza cf. fulva]
MSDQVILFDMPTKPPARSWSLNPWKARLILNYKSIPYTTHWLEVPDIAPHLSSLSIPPNPQPSTPTTIPTSPYTVPAIRLPVSEGGKYIMDSKLIAKELESLYPDPPLALDTPAQQRIEALWLQVMKNIGPALMPGVVKQLLTEKSIPYFIQTREKASGISFAEMEKLGPGAVEKAWKGAGPPLREIAEVMREGNGDGVRGPFVEGREVGFADFVLVGGMAFLRECGEGAFERLVGVDKGFGRLWEACGRWVERDT